MGNNKIGIVYKVVNKETNQIYIGATTDNMLKRKQDHLQKAHKNVGSKFQNAIATYGSEAFLWTQIDTASCIDELAKKEKEYVAEYNSKEDGYNGDIGGGMKKTIYQYNIDNGSLIKTFESLDAAANEIGAIKQQISKSCLSVNQTYGGFIWSYDFKEPYLQNFDKRRKEVYQFDLEGKFLSKYDSISEASEKTGVNITSIAKVCRGERNFAGSSKWEY